MAKLEWDQDAEEAIARARFFVRPLARRRIEEEVRTSGGGRVTLADVRKAEKRFRSARGDKSHAELQQMMPQPNQPGADLLAVEICRSTLTGCPNALIDPAKWQGAVEDWARDNDISERLRGRVGGDHVLHHHKLRISISGCPNGCSRPQIADIGIVGTVRPDVSADECTACGACEQACPDGAITVDDAPPEFDRDICQGCIKCRDACPDGCITLSEPRALILMGGKLGRHPHLAEPAGTAQNPDHAIRLIDHVIGDYLERARAGERFAAFCIRCVPNRV